MQRFNGLDVCSGPTPGEPESVDAIDRIPLSPVAEEVDDFHGRSSAAKHARFRGPRKAQTSGGWNPDDVR